MPAYKKLPEDDELRRLVRDGLTDQQIADMFQATREGVRYARKKANPPIERDGVEPRVRHRDYLPWRIRADHAGDLLARRIRAYSKMQQGKPMSATERRLLDVFMKFMDGENPRGVPLSVHYDRNDPEGFWLETRRDGDRDYISPPTS